MSSGGVPVAIIVAAIVGAVSIFTLAFNSLLSGHRERTNRQRDVFSKAFTERCPHGINRTSQSVYKLEKVGLLRTSLPLLHPGNRANAC